MRLIPILLAACTGASTEVAEPPAPPAPVAAAPAAAEVPLSSTKPKCTLAATCVADCDSGDSLACSQAGLWYQYGLAGVTRDPQRAARLQERSCELGAGVGCFNLAAQRLHGVGVSKDIALAESLLVKAHDLFARDCAAGASGWCVNQGLMILQGQGVPSDTPRAVAILRKACTEGHAAACIALSGTYLQSDRGAARSLLQESCGMGRIEACAPLGETYLDETPPQPANAHVFFKMGCDAGDPRACRNLGFQKLTGQGTAADEQRGLELMQFACTSAVSPDPSACYLAGLTLLTGAPGIMPSPQKGAETLAMACWMGNPAGCTLSAQIATQGIGPYANTVDAREFLQMACSLGMADACRLLEGALP